MPQYRFTQRATNVPNSGIGYMMRYASKYEDVISLGQGTPLFPTPAFIYNYLHQRSLTDTTIGQYASNKIETELKTLIVKKMQQIYGFKPALEEIYLTVGGIGALFATMMVLLEQGDEVVYFDPSYPLHLSQIHLCQAKPIFVSYQEEKGWTLDLEKLEKSITKRTKAIILTNPNNPTGTVLTQSEVEQLAEIVLKYDLLLILDEAYEFLTYETPFFSPLRIAKLRSHTILCKSFSKEFAMTGWRIGYAYAPKEIISAINNLHTYFSISPATPSMIAMIAALSDNRGERATNEFKKKFEESRQAICERLDNLPRLFSYHKPDGAYYVFPKLLGFKVNAFNFAKKLVDEARVISIPGSTMGPSGKGHLRMSFAADAKVIHTAFDRIDAFAKEYHLL